MKNIKEEIITNTEEMEKKTRDYSPEFFVNKFAYIFIKIFPDIYSRLKTTTKKTKRTKTTEKN